MESSGFWGWLSRVPFVPFSTALIAGLLLVAGNTTADWLGLRDYRQWIAVVFLVAAILVLGEILHFVWGQGCSTWAARSAVQKLYRRLHTMTQPEAMVLLEFQKQRTTGVNPDKNAVLSLTTAGVISPAPLPAGRTPRGVGALQPYTIAEWAWEYIQKHPDVVPKIAGST